LKVALTDERAFHIGSVTYLDFEKDKYTPPFGTLGSVFLKRRSFEHEREIRVVRLDGKLLLEPTKSLQLDCKIPELIDKIYLSPRCDDWLVPHVKLLLDRFGFGKIPVQKSDLYAERMY